MLDEKNLQKLISTIQIYYPELDFSENSSNYMLAKILFKEVKHTSQDTFDRMCELWILHHKFNQWRPVQFLEIYEDIREQGART